MKTSNEKHQTDNKENKPQWRVLQQTAVAN